MVRKRIFFIIIIILIALLLVLYVAPYLYLMLTSFKASGEAVTVPPTFFPKNFTLENYSYITEFPAVMQSFVNSLVIAVISTVLAIVAAVPAAYSVTRFGTRPGRMFLIFALVTRLLPYVSIAIPFFIIMKQLGLVDTHLAVALAHTTINLPLAIWLLSSFMEGLPVEIEESAFIDGCSRLGALMRIIVPTAMSGIAVTALFCFLMSWNEFLFSLILTSVDAKTAPIAIAEFKTQYSIEWGAMSAVATVFSFPVVIFSLFMQRKIVSGMTMGAVKQ